MDIKLPCCWECQHTINSYYCIFLLKYFVYTLICTWTYVLVIVIIILFCTVNIESIMQLASYSDQMFKLLVNTCTLTWVWLHVNQGYVGLLSLSSNLHKSLIWIASQLPFAYQCFTSKIFPENKIYTHKNSKKVVEYYFALRQLVFL